MLDDCFIYIILFSRLHHLVKLQEKVTNVLKSYYYYYYYYYYYWLRRYLCHPNNFHPVFTTNILYTFLIFLMLSACPSHLPNTTAWIQYTVSAHISRCVIMHSVWHKRNISFCAMRAPLNSAWQLTFRWPLPPSALHAARPFSPHWFPKRACSATGTVYGTTAAFWNLKNMCPVL